MPFRSAAVTIAVAAAAAAALPVPETVTYQGVLEDQNGPVDKPADLQVNIIAPGDGVVDTQTFNAVPFDEGNFTIQLAFPFDVLAFDAGDFDGRDYELEFCVRDRAGSSDPFVCLAPTQRLSTTPYAFHANTADDPRAPAAVIGQPFEQPSLLINPANGSIVPNILADEYPLLINTDTNVNYFPSDGTALFVAARNETAAVSAWGGRFGIQAFSSNTDTGPSVGVLGAVRSFPTIDVSEHAGVRGSGPGGQALLGTFTHAAEFTGDLRVDNGTLSRAYAPDTQDLIHPIAYGFINASGTVASATPNISAVWNPTFNWYEITIDNEDYFFSSYSTVVTTTVSGAVPRTSSSAGRLIVQIVNASNGTTRQANFNFVTYKPNGAAELQGRSRPNLEPLINPVLDADVNVNAPFQPRSPSPARPIADPGVLSND